MGGPPTTTTTGRLQPAWPWGRAGPRRPRARVVYSRPHLVVVVGRQYGRLVASDRVVGSVFCFGKVDRQLLGKHFKRGFLEIGQKQT